MQTQYKKHKKIMFRNWFFILLYSFSIFWFFSNCVYKDVPLNSWFFESITWFDLWVFSWIFLFVVLILLKIYEALSNPLWDKIVKIPRKFLRNMYFLYNFLFLWPLLFKSISDLTLFWWFWRIILWLSPFLFYVFRFFAADFVWSDKFVRWLFRLKDIRVWSCPCCHEYILKKPNSYCPNCGNEKHGEKWYCLSCGFDSRVLDFDFPNFCPHCGLWFKYRRIKKHI